MKYRKEFAIAFLAAAGVFLLSTGHSEGSWPLIAAIWISLDA